MWKHYVLTSLFLCLSIQATASEKKPTPFLGISMEGINLTLPKNPKIKKGIKIKFVLQNTAAKQAGLKANDIIISYDDQIFNNITENEQLRIFKDYLTKEKKISQNLNLAILRSKTQLLFQNQRYDLNIIPQLNEKLLPNQSVSLIMEKQSERMPFNITLRQKPFERLTPPPTHNPFETIKIQNTPINKNLKKSLSNEKYLKQYKTVQNGLAETEWWDDGNRLNLIRYTRQNPIKGIQTISILFKKIHADLSETPSNLNRCFQLLTPPTKQTSRIKKTFPKNQSLEKHLDWIELQLTKANQSLNKAFSQLSTENKQSILKTLPFLTDELVKRYALSALNSTDSFEKSEIILALSKKVNLNQLKESYHHLQFFKNPHWQKQLKKTILKHHKKSPSPNIIKRETPLGPIIIGTRENDHYTESALLILDPSGNDTYLNNSNLSDPFSLILDWDGNDYYFATEPLAQGAQCLGIGILIDKKGNDHYVNKQWGQGAAFFGIGELIDHKGNDTYIANSLSQGIAFCGIGILEDLSGNDTYQIQSFGQAVGLPKGLGILYDQSGHDTYTAMGEYKSSYDTPNVFKGAAQGFGIGFREMGSGGIGLLIDGEGKDHFLAGNFAQGTGYFYAMGALLNLGHQNDIYRASRYGQAAAAHQAIGFFLDEGGNDHYTGNKGAILSASWDQSVTGFIDESGNDTYQTKDLFFSVAAAEHSSFALFYDPKGKDTYQIHQKSGMASNSYHNGTSLGIWIKTNSKNKSSTLIGNSLLRNSN